MAKTATAEALNPDGLWGVKDLNARERPRVHTPLPGVSYPLTAGQYHRMPAEHAVLFLSEGFEVVNQDDEPVANLPATEVGTTGTVRPTLNPGEVIAKLDELTVEALLARAKQRPGGERFKANSPKKLLVEFLLKKPKRADATGKPAANDAEDEDPDADIELEDLDPETAKKILEGK